MMPEAAEPPHLATIARLPSIAGALAMSLQQSHTRFEFTDTRIPMHRVSDARLSAVADAFGWTDPLRTDDDETAEVPYLPDSDLREHLEERGFFVTSRGQTTLSVIGALFLLDDPSRHLGKVLIDIHHLQARDQSMQRISIVGPLDRQVRVAVDAVMTMVAGETTPYEERGQQATFLRTVVYEAIANAVAHRSYENSGAPIRVDLTAEQMKITSPGGFFASMTPDRIRGAQAIRNPEIMRTLQRLNVTRDAGKGVAAMQDAMAAMLLDGPRFRDTGNAVEATISLDSPLLPEERSWLVDLRTRRSLSAEDCLVLARAARSGSVTNKDVRELTGDSSIEARSRVQMLCGRGFLFQSGVRGRVSYRKSIEVPPSTPDLAQPGAQLALALAKDGPLTPASLADAAGLAHTNALGLLEALVNGGWMRRIARDRKRAYELADDRAPDSTRSASG